MRPEVRLQFEWQRLFLPEIIEIVGKSLAPHLFTAAPTQEDMHENTDLMILRARDIRVACRVRKEEYLRRYRHDVTFRSSVASGVKTEAHKLMAGYGHAFFYGFIVGDRVRFWTLLSLNVFREIFSGLNEDWNAGDLIHYAAALGIMECGQKSNLDGMSDFIHFDVRELTHFNSKILIASEQPVPLILPLFDRAELSMMVAKNRK